jgi:uncharacterized membrane protein
MSRRPQVELRPTNRRMEAFSDGVFAIAITIMVIDIRIPDSLAFANDPQALREFLTILGTYVLSFYVIANLWTSHHYLIFTLMSPARITIWYNNLLLFCVTLLPIATRFLGQHPSSPRAAATYGLVGAMCTAAFILLRTHAARITHNELHRGIHRRVLRRAWAFFAIYVVSMPLAFVNVWLAWLCFVIVPPMLFFPIIRAQVRPKATTHEHHELEQSCP